MSKVQNVIARMRAVDKLLKMAVPAIRLSSGIKMPIIGLGMWL
ncbi:unnamed protein product, partial [Brugia timori]|uniref:ABC transporter permease n=1 Tax=Brugia timori TaxID=42155 RepID=A0A0R3R6Q7_9BILA